MTGYPFDIAITAAVFDLWHEGHGALAEFMGQHAPIRVAFIHDGMSTLRNKRRIPVQTLAVRMENAASAGGFLVAPVRHQDPTSTIHDFLLRLPAGTRVAFIRGDDTWPGGRFPGQDYLEEHGIPIILKPYTKGVSSTERRNAAKP